MSGDASSWIIDVTEENFEREVIERSNEVPVVVDFWAEWCGPCRVLGPVLEKLAAESQGGFVLAKINVDQAQGLAMKYDVMGIPSVKAFRDGKPALEFTGSLPEPAVRDFLRKIVPSQADELVTAAASGSADPQEGYRRALELEPGHPRATLGLAQCHLSAGRLEEAFTLAENLVAPEELSEARDRLLALIALKRNRPEAVEAKPRDAAGLLALGQSLAADEEFEKALEVLLEAATADKDLARGPVKETMVRVFQTIGVRSELADEYRNKLTRILY